MPSTRLVHRSEFCAAFRLNNPDFDEAWNAATFGVCNSPHFHGHNWQMEIEVEGAVDPDTGMVLNFLHLDKLVQAEVLQPLDHKNLNIEVPFLQGVLPTTENLAACIWQRLAEVLPEGVRLVEVRLQESASHSVAYQKS